MALTVYIQRARNKLAIEHLLAELCMTARQRLIDPRKDLVKVTADLERISSVSSEVSSEDFTGDTHLLFGDTS
ncbi:MAG: hypothetical protein OXC05_06440 [Halieaceae bacterium]|nr:hypothetical protein [Halieaceae bacterium]